METKKITIKEAIEEAYLKIILDCLEGEGNQEKAQYLIGLLGNKKFIRNMIKNRGFE